MVFDKKKFNSVDDCTQLITHSERLVLKELIEF